MWRCPYLSGSDSNQRNWLKNLDLTQTSWHLTEKKAESPKILSEMTQKAHRVTSVQAGNVQILHTGKVRLLLVLIVCRHTSVLIPFSELHGFSDQNQRSQAKYIIHPPSLETKTAFDKKRNHGKTEYHPTSISLYEQGSWNGVHCSTLIPRTLRIEAYPHR